MNLTAPACPGRCNRSTIIYSGSFFYISAFRSTCASTTSWMCVFHPVPISPPKFRHSVLHRKAFHNINYFFFFFNVILGIMSCLFRFIKSAAVCLMFLSRIERPIMPEGFEKQDLSKTVVFFLPFKLIC